MDLLPEQVRKLLPPLYSQEGVQDAVAQLLCCAQHKTCYVSATVM